jgi:hypothetical protein
MLLLSARRSPELASVRSPIALLHLKIIWRGPRCEDRQVTFEQHVDSMLAVSGAWRRQSAFEGLLLTRLELEWSQTAVFG